MKHTFKEASSLGLVQKSTYTEHYQFKLFKCVAIMREGHGFGDVALIEEKGKRKASI
jgi:hypothetical protein